MCSDLDAAPERDELDFEFLGNRTGQPYVIQTNVYRSGVGGREMRHSLWFDPTADFHTYSILWNPKQIVFFVDKVPIREYRNSEKTNTFFPIMKPMYVFSSIWNADDWATRGGLEKTDWTKAPFISSYSDFTTDACAWGPAAAGGGATPPPSCAAATGYSWWDQPPRGRSTTPSARTPPGWRGTSSLRLLRRPQAVPRPAGGVRAPDDQLVIPPPSSRDHLCGQDGFFGVFGYRVTSIFFGLAREDVTLEPYIFFLDQKAKFLQLFSLSL
ncbi:hypothetical protein GUJ93_ZPchr0007g3277 [Zizania palustris]|uniref:GH16 domain-containing protein n=1 Tax=Zizania palustris TaxID=103762 RepID=A0A8J5T5U2_ZIZPA|nr:hypothetical protein GUJ93_ZPchr0007g3277 [Zizania palustris]